MIKKRLLRLELVGYKTFASRTIFEFGEGVNCIIGPNGSGKSNIVDSLRWVLGEQSYSLLRGKKTDDMIFNGSQQRTRASMASAALTFDNSDNWLAIDFAEVTITRRAYRDGRNEYFINDQRARLKDIAELLGKVGLAQRNYTIIGQGLIDHFLMLKTDERRAIFEEAAGIGVYQDKRSESLRRLEQTQHNQERIEDILVEIRPRLKALEKQAERARQAQAIQQTLLAHLRIWYGYQWETLQLTLGDARTLAEQAQQALQEQQDLQNLAEISLNELRTQIGNLRAQLASWRRETARQHTEHEAVARQLAVAEERQRNLKEQSARLQSDLVQYEAALNLHQERLLRAQQETQRLEKERNEARTQTEQLEALRRKRILERQTLTSQLQQAEQTLQVVEKRQTEHNARQVSLQQRQEQLANELANSHAQAENAKSALSAQQNNERDKQALLTQAQSAMQAAQQEQQGVQAQLAQCEASLAQQQAALAQAITATQKLIARQQALAEAQENSLDQNRKLLRQAQKQGQLRGLQGEVATLLQSPPEYDAAIAAALGAALQANLVEDWQAIDDAIRILNGKNNGQVSLLSLAQLRPPEPIPLQASGFLGWATDLVQCTPGARPVVDVLLGRVAVCADRESARQLLGTLPAGGLAVTREGEVYRADGLVILGRGGGAQTLALAREVRALPAQVATAQQNQNQLEAERNRAQAQRQELTQAVGQARHALSEAQNAVQAATRQWQTAHLEVERAQSRQQIQRELVEKTQKEQAKLGEEIKKLEGEKSQLQQQRQQQETQLRQIKGSLSEFDADNPTEQLPQWQTRLAVAEQSLRQTRLQSEDLQQQLQNAHKQVEQRLAQRKQLESEVQQVSQRISGLHDQDIQFQNSIEELRALRRPAEQKLEGLEAEQTNAESTESAGRTRLLQAQQRNANAQLTLSRRQDEQQRLQQQIMDDFGPVELDAQTQNTLPLEEVVQKLEVVKILPSGIEEQIKQARVDLRKLGAINPDALQEHAETLARHDDLIAQLADLTTAGQELREIISELDILMEREFRKTYDAVAKQFGNVFTRLFNGGSARLVLTDPENIHNTGIDIIAQLPGRREQGLELLSGGERSLTACALIFALLQTAPTPFAVLDEVDAMLDEANVGRLRDLLLEMAQKTQFLVVTHNRNTVEAANTVYGISMSPDSTSKQISLRLDGKVTSNE